MKKLKKIFRIFMWFVLVIGTFIISGFINRNFKEEKCVAVIIEIEDAESYGFIDEGDITHILNNEFNTPISQKIKDISTYAIETRLNEHPAIEKAEVYISIDGKLIITLNQRKPILRIFGKTGSFYIDHKGKVMPVSNKYSAHVPVVTGYINLDYNRLLRLTNENKEAYDTTQIPKLYFDIVEFSKFIQNHPFWKAQIEQLYVNKESEFEMIPRVGNHTIVIGEVYNLESKFNKLMLFYEKGLSKTGWNEYKTINLKFKGQVVCTKRY